MSTIHRLADSCLLMTTDTGTTLLDPGFFSWDSDEVDLGTIGDVQRVLITHEHGDHVKPEFVKWLVDRGGDVTVHSNQAVSELLARHDIEAVTTNPAGIISEDVSHELTPLGTAPPNRSFTVDGVLTFPGDTYRIDSTAPVLALAMMAPWGSTTASVDFARRLSPRQVVPVHDFYLSASGRKWVSGLVAQALSDSGIEVVPLDWGESYTV